MEVQMRRASASESHPGTETDETMLESIQLRTIFPEEVWLEVLKKLFHPEDLRRFKESSKLFEKLFQNIKTKVLFPAVIKTIFTKCNLEPTHMKTLLLTCRLVCRTWDLGVNAVLKNIVNLYSFKWDSDPIIPFEHINIDLTYDQRPLEFLRHFNDTYAVGNRCPFICSSVSVEFGNDFTLAKSKYISGLSSIFIKYGHNLSHFCAELHENKGLVYRRTGRLKKSKVWCLEQLRDFVQLMPNLKALKITWDRSLLEENVKSLNQTMQKFVFPPLKMLQHLHLEGVPKPVFDALLRSYSHVSMLSILPSQFQSGFEDGKALYTQHMPNLTDLSFFLNNKKLARLELSNIMWPLKTLQLQVVTITLDWEKLFKVLEARWADTLTELSLNILPDENYHPMLLLPSLKLSNLKVLLIFAKKFVSLDFILEVKNSLEYLVVYWEYVSERRGERVEPQPEFEKENVIKFYCFRRNLMNSNIWQLLPKLNKIEYHDYEVGKLMYYRKKPNT